MKRNQNKRPPASLFRLAVLAAVIAIGLAGCDNGASGDGGSDNNGNGNDGGGSTTYTYTFSNQSSLSVHIEGSDLSPSDFYVGTGSTKTATSSKSNAFFAYDTGGAGSVAFDSNWSTHTFSFSNQ